MERSGPAPLACVLGCAGPALSDDEIAFFRDTRPWGFILFARNVVDAGQVRALTAALRAAADRPAAPVFIDQEGGRVQRLAPPIWRRYPPARAYAALPMDLSRRRELVRLGARLMAHDLANLGIDVDCAPVVDVPARGSHDVIGDRAYGDTASRVAVLARACAEGLIAGGVLPVVKHIPGHGRAGVDSHEGLPIVDADLADLDRVDFAAFKALSDMPLAMTAHVLYAAVDALEPATTSERVISRVIREIIGFDGLLISDDVSMNALRGDLTARSRAAAAAGCDVVLHCNGDMSQMKAVVAGCPALLGRAASRAEAALGRKPKMVEPFDAAEGWAELEAAFGDDRPR